jgi:hypothetical protein
LSAECASTSDAALGTSTVESKMLRVILTAFLLFASIPARALDTTSLTLLAHAWPDAKPANVSEVGRGIGVVFSPDLSVPGNCRFYEALGFACFEDGDWNRVVDRIQRHNTLYPERRIGTLVLETHGTNGNGLKLQSGHSIDDDRSYIAVGALQERLEPAGVANIIISACNSGRLLRPQIHARLNPNPGDKLFLPATCGIVNASPEWNAERSAVTVITPSASHIETTLVGSVSEFAPATRRALLAAAKARGIAAPKQFAVSDMMVQMLLRDPRLALTANSYVDELSKTVQPAEESERLFARFLKYLDAIAARASAPRPALRAGAGPAARRATTPAASPRRVR